MERIDKINIIEFSEKIVSNMNKTSAAGNTKAGSSGSLPLEDKDLDDNLDLNLNDFNIEEEKIKLNKKEIYWPKN